MLGAEPSAPHIAHRTAVQFARNHELMRGLKDGKPFVLMEQTPSVTNWQPFNALKRPGVMRLWSYQAVAHGSDSVMFFQMRRSIGACEKYHGAIIDHAGHEHTRVFREAAALGAELQKLGGKTLGSRIKADVGILFDWDNWWAIEYSAGPSVLLKYRDEINNYYTALHGQNIPADILSVDGDLDRYKVIIAPVLYMVKPGVDEKLRRFVKNGGVLVTTFFSGYVNETDIVTVGGYPGKLRDILGIWVEESDALPENGANHFTWNGRRYPATLLCDLLHSEGAEVLASYEEDFYAGMPVLTCNQFGGGKAYYVAARSDGDFYSRFLQEICAGCGVEPTLRCEGVEATRRVGSQGEYLFLLNHGQESRTVTADRDYVDCLSGQRIARGEPVQIGGVDVRILESK